MKMATSRVGWLAVGLVMSCVTFQLASAAATCIFKECSCTKTTIDCRRKGLDEIPQLQKTSSVFTDLLLQGNNITFIREDTIPHGIDNIDLRDNPVNDIAPLAFRYSSQTLKVIRFRGATFSTLPSALEGLDSLETLDIEDVALKNYPDTVLTKLSRTLTELRLKTVGITIFPTWLSKLVFLRKLDLGGNQMGNIPATALVPFAEELTDLNLSGTGVTSTTAVTNLKVLQRLDMSNNKIANSIQLSYDLIPSLNTLTFIDFSGNVMSTLPRLAMLTHLTEINFNANRFSVDVTGAFPSSLLTLSLGDNKFKDVPKDLLRLPGLTNFSIANNAITRFSSRRFAAKSKLQSLYMGGASLTDIDEHAFLNSPHLTYLNLEGTSLEHMPLALGTLKELSELWMPGNDKLKCTCDDAHVLGSWITLTNTHVIGECGTLAIKSYFTDLARHCPP